MNKKNIQKAYFVIDQRIVNNSNHEKGKFSGES